MNIFSLIFLNKFDTHFKKIRNMKKIILKMLIATGIVAGAALSTNAQISKGSIMLGGSLGANMKMESKTTIGSITNTKPGHTDWNFSPTGGYFVADGLVVGLGLNLESNFLEEVLSADSLKKEHIMASGLGINLIVRKYFEIENNIYFHLQGGFGYNTVSATDRVPDGLSALKDGDKITSSAIGINVTPGLTYFVSPKWGIDFSLNNIVSYNSTTTTIGDGATKVEITGGGFSVGAGLTPSLGLFFYINK